MNKVIIKTKIKSTSNEFIDSLNSEELASFKKGYKKFTLSELILALRENDAASIRKLVKIASNNSKLLASSVFVTFHNCPAACWTFIHSF